MKNKSEVNFEAYNVSDSLFHGQKDKSDVNFLNPNGTVANDFQNNLDQLTINSILSHLAGGI